MKSELREFLFFSSMTFTMKVKKNYTKKFPCFMDDDDRGLQLRERTIIAPPCRSFLGHVTIVVLTALLASERNDTTQQSSCSNVGGGPILVTRYGVRHHSLGYRNSTGPTGVCSREGFDKSRRGGSARCNWREIPKACFPFDCVYRCTDSTSRTRRLAD